jgi:ubiquinone/menaquinone biosynthesis C-methylase UbiE
MAELMSAVPDQRLFWDRWHETHTTAGKGSHGDDSLQIFADNLPHGKRLRVLELGCGQGKQAIHLARSGHYVCAVDRSPVAIAAAERNAADAGVAVEFTEHDMTYGLPYQDNSFTGAFSHLSLHYFDDAVMRDIINELTRVLQPGGLLFFTVRSTRDPFYGLGDWLSRDMYCYEGHVRRFFDREYVLKELADWDVHMAEYYNIGGDRRANPGIYLRVLANLHSTCRRKPVRCRR